MLRVDEFKNRQKRVQHKGAEKRRKVKVLIIEVVFVSQKVALKNQNKINLFEIVIL